MRVPAPVAFAGWFRMRCRRFHDIRFVSATKKVQSMSRRLYACLLACLAPVTLILILIGLPTGAALASRAEPETAGLAAVVAQPPVPDATTPISVARAAGAGWSGSLQGNVILPPDVFNAPSSGSKYFAIQDASGGMYIYRSSSGPTLPAMALGDVVQITGTLVLYNGLLEVNPLTGVANLGSGTVPDPLVVATGGVTPTQGLLVQVEGTFGGYGAGKTCTTPPMSGDCNFWLDDGSGAIQIFVDKDSQINASGYTTATHVKITGISTAYNRAQVAPRYQSDVWLPGPLTVLNTVPAGGATGVMPSTTVQATFSNPMNASTINSTTFTLQGPSGTVAGTVSYAAGTQTATFAPSASLAYSTRYTATLTTGIQDAFGAYLSSAYTWSFTTGTDVTPIGTARAAGAGWSGSLQGNATVLPGMFRTDTFAIQDATGGMYIYKGGGTGIPTMQLGDSVRVTGTLKLYNGLLEMDPTTSIVNTGPGTVPAPLTVTTNAVNPTQGLLIQVSGAISTTSGTWSPPVPGASNFTFYVNDGSGPVQVFADLDTHIDLRDLAYGQQVRLIGFSSNNYGTPQIMPRRQLDVIDLRPPTVTSTDPVSGTTGVSLYYPKTATFNKMMNATTINTATFLLEGPGGPVAGTVGYVASTRTAVFTPTAALAAQTLYTATITTGAQDTNGIALAAPYVWTFTTGDADTTAPTILARTPDIGATGVTFNARVVITFSEVLRPETVIASNFTLTGPAGTIPWDALTYDSATSKLTLDPPTFAALTTYTATVSTAVTDWAGNPVSATLTWSFTTAPEPTMYPYHGDIHNHTSISDGSGTPTQALAAGKAAGFDFMAITDHSYAIDDSAWADTLSAVNAATTSDFVAVRGFEYTQGAEGHINVYNSVRHAVRTDTGCTYCDYTPNLETGVTVDGFYHWLSITGTQALDGDGTVMQFNHPGWINFNDWTFHPEVAATARLEEIGNGNGSSYVFSEDEFIRSLDYGWKVGATNNADTHTTYWGTNTDHRTGVWMAGLTRTDLLDALRARRTFATEDKNYELGMKANNFWMGSEFANTGTIAFTITGNDPDGESGDLVQIITYGGEVVTQTTFAAAQWTWQPALTISTGAHYYFVKVTQADGDRIVTSPVWTTSTADVRVTDLTIEPTIATIYNPSLITARIDNRGVATATVTVTFQVDGSPIGAVPVIVGPCTYGPCSDGYAYISWQPVLTGTVTVSASFTGAPAGDNLEDNTAEKVLNVTDEQVPLVLIDAGHGNIGAQPRDARLFAEDLTAHGYNVLFNLDAITASDLNTTTVKLLIINAYGPDQFTSDEITAVSDFVAAGGSIWFNGMSDYTGKVSWANTVRNRMNALVAAIETRTTTQIPIRFNDDEVMDANNNNGYVFGVQWHIFPVSNTTGIGMNVVQAQSWSDVSLVDRNMTALTPSDLGTDGFISVLGDLDEGNSGPPWYDPFRTYNEDADGEGDAFIYPSTTAIPCGAGWDIPGAPGRLYFFCDANDPYNIFSYTAGDGKQNEALNLETAMWLMGEPLQLMTISEARVDPELNNTPDHLDQLVWVEGDITAAYGEFFNSMVIQDATGGITLHAPAGDIDPLQYSRGKHVRVVGTVGIYQGDTELEFFEAEQVQIISTTVNVPAPLVLSTHDASLESNQGWLVQVTGRVVSIVDDYAFIVDDGSGPVRVFIDGYNGDFTDAQVGDLAVAIGIDSEDGDGPRIRVRERVDVTLTHQPYIAVAPGAVTASALPNTLVTETLTISNLGGVTLTYSLAAVPARTWLSFAPTAGEVAPLTDAPVGVYFNTTGLAVGVYTTTLRITNNDPWLNPLDVPVTLTVTCDAITGLDFSFLPTAPLSGRTVTFTAVAAGTLPITYGWNFGDGGTGNGSPINHVFPLWHSTGSNTYTVTLTATNACSSPSISHTVTVIPYRIFLPLAVRNAP